MHGAKRWVLWPPEHASYAQRHVSLSVPNASEGALYCEQRAGEVLIVPETWGHATLNRRPSVGWATELQFDRTFDLGLGAAHGREWWREAEVPPRTASTHEGDGDGEEQQQQAAREAAQPPARRGHRRTRTRRKAGAKNSRKMEL